MDQMNQEERNQEAGAPALAVYLWLLSLSVGLAIGAGIGAAIGRVALGVSLGVAAGVSVGFLMVQRVRRSNSKDS